MNEWGLGPCRVGALAEPGNSWCTRPLRHLALHDWGVGTGPQANAAHILY